MGDVHQLVPLQGHRPHVRPENQVLHREGGQVLDLPVPGEAVWKVKHTIKVNFSLLDHVLIGSDLAQKHHSVAVMTETDLLLKRRFVTAKMSITHIICEVESGRGLV